MPARRLLARHDGTCAACGTAVAAPTAVFWDEANRRLTCRACGPARSDIGAGSGGESRAGGSAQNRYDSLSSRREHRIREAHPRLGGVIFALSEEPRSTTAWARGAAGERHVGAVLDGLKDKGVVTLHDRRIPRRQANIDHLAVTPTGVWVIDAKRYQGRVAKKDVGGWWSTDERLYVNHRDRTALIDSMPAQVGAVQEALGPNWARVPIHPLLCFVDAEWPWRPRPFAIMGVTVAWPLAIGPLLCQPGTLNPGELRQIADRLSRRLPPAS